MSIRFVLDESSWAGASKANPVGVLTDAIERLLDRLEVARRRGERVAKYKEYYEADLGGGLQLFSLLFDSSCPVRLDRDLASQLYLALDRANDFDDSTLAEYDAVFDGDVRRAPGAAWAHASCREGHQVAVLPLPLGEMPVGRVSVTITDTKLGIFFVTRESHHVAFFRSIVRLENADEAKFASLARSAFPALGWADDIWRGLRDFSRPYIAVRDELVHCLGGLSDHGASCFCELRAAPGELGDVLSANVGAPISDENGRTKRHSPSQRDRTRWHRGREKVFWWHVKLRPNIDRIHFLYEPPSESSSGLREGRIVVGLFKDHCILPT